MFSPNGSIPDRWHPSGTENNWTINPNGILSPFIPFQDDLLVIEGVDMVSTRYGPGGGHQKGMGHMLTGTQLLQGNFPSAGSGTAGFPGGISVDQHIANALDVEALTLAVKPGGGNNIFTRMSYSGPNRPVTPR